MPMPVRPAPSAALLSPGSTARWVTLVPAALAALWFLLIGGHALFTGAHFGPLGAAYWAEALDDAGVGTRLVGAALVLWGLGWCAVVYALVAGRDWLWPLALALGFLSLWQEPVGTFLGLYVLGALAFFKAKLRGGTERGRARQAGLGGRRGRPKGRRSQALRRR